MPSGASLVGQQVALTVSEPWSFGTELGVGPHFGEIVAERMSPDVTDAMVVVRMDARLVHQGSDYSLVRATSRSSESVRLDRLLAGDQVFCNLRAVTPRESATGWVEDDSSGLIGTLEVRRT
jgi:hypothetical protein